MKQENVYEIALNAYVNSLHNRSAIEALGLTLLSDNQMDNFKNNFNDRLNDIVNSEQLKIDDSVLADVLSRLSQLSR